MLALNVFAADTTAEAQYLFTSPQQQFVNLVRGVPGLLPAPVEDMDQVWQAHEKPYVKQALSCSVIGNPAEVKQGIRNFIAKHQPDELMLTAMMHDPKARQYSFQIAADLITE
jgi:alkanesulfonate monooxygenase SsuD/methylene tetrahydromethanopterin reductase-like flavin-dependent oxidoreductase (luciferase family)